MSFFNETEMARINRLIVMGGYAGMTELQFFAAEIKEWKGSKKRKEQITGDAYYEGDHDILRRQRTIIGEDGKLQVVTNLPNNRLVDNQFALMVDQKTNYLVGKPFTVTCKNKTYADLLTKVFDKRFNRLLKYVCEDALKGGIGWLFPYYGDDGQLTFKHFPAHEILPFWTDDDHTILDCAIRLYPQEVYNGYTKEIVERVEIFKPDGIWRYIYSDPAGLTPDTFSGDHENYFSAESEDETVELNWERIPLIPFKYNKQEIPLIRRLKTLQDGINTMLSDFENNMQEDARNTILILKNYDGENLGEFRHNLATYGAVKVRDDGGVETLAVEINAENFNSILKLFKDKLIENARGYNAKDDRMGNNPNQMNIQSMYSDIDLDANGMETEFQAAFDDLLWFINQDFANTGRGDYDGEGVTIVFNRDMLINESEAIENCSKSVGILSNETIVAQHPWTTDVDMELERLQKEKEEAMAQAQEYGGAFGNVQNNNSNGDEGGDE
ncbi:phage portal protein [Anaerotruncus colihominis]|uniref:phage portal protein n=1 Tax=Anaerotruncus colihominis TaxID=169435 RepID=UPI001FAD32E6|nr:phage portal protein [Anaerotruncus colihominis]